MTMDRWNKLEAALGAIALLGVSGFVLAIVAGSF
jgi:hypothetical protein